MDLVSSLPQQKREEDKMALRGFRIWFGRVEEIFEDTLLVLISLFAVILAVTALFVLGTQTAPGMADRVAILATITQLSFLAKAEYFATLMLPWVAMIIGLLIARELWMMRRRIEGIHFETVLYRLRSTAPIRMPVRPVVRRAVRRRR